MASVNLKSPSRDARPGCCDWFTGLPGVGKTTVANELRDALLQHAGVCIVLNGDELGKGLNHDLGFNREDRCENVRPIAQLGSILVDAGLVVPVAVIAPDREERQAVRELFNGRGYAEAYVATTQAICVAHDPRGLYQRALDGKLNGMPPFADACSSSARTNHPKCLLSPTSLTSGAKNLFFLPARLAT